MKTNSIKNCGAGGQPFDTGVIASAAGVKFTVSEVRANREDGVILHIGTFAEADTTFQAGDEVELQIDEAKRRLHARLHSGAPELLSICQLK